MAGDLYCIACFAVQTKWRRGEAVHKVGTHARAFLAESEAEVQRLSNEIAYQEFPRTKDWSHHEGQAYAVPEHLYTPHAEGERLRADLREARARVAALEAENARLRGEVARKAGKARNGRSRGVQAEYDDCVEVEA